MMSEFFYQITPEIVLEAAKIQGYEPTGHCMVLNSYENRVYDLTLEDDSHIILKFYRPGRWTKSQILQEHSFLFELSSHEIPVCVPLKPDGKNTLFAIENVYYTIWPRTGGRSKSEFTDTELQILGRYLARMHNVGSVSDASERLLLNSENFARVPMSFLLKENWIPGHLQSRFEKAVNAIIEKYDLLVKDIPVHRIHGDCHPGNLLDRNGDWFFLDFDDFLTGPAVQDIWMLLPTGVENAEYKQELFLNAYREFRDFDDAWLELIEPLRALRFIHYAYWIARRWQDPAFPAAFPHFGTENYWQELVLDIEEQNQKIIHSDNNESTKANEPELSNKDFFWDWEEKK